MAEDINNTSEKFDKIKETLQKNKKIVVIAIAALFALLLLSDFYNDSKVRKSEQASELFQQLLVSKTSDIDKLKSIADDLMNDYSSTPYAARAQIIYVKTFIKNNEVNDDVTKRLLWASDNSVEPSIQSLSNYYLGLMALSVNSFEEASRFANQIKSKGFQGFKFDLLGDIAHSEGKIEEARNHYQKAITSFSAQSDFARVIEYKLQNL